MKHSLLMLMLASMLLAVLPVNAQETPAALERQTLLDGKIEILIPNDFEALDSATLNDKYTGENKPKMVYSSPMYNVNLAFSVKPTEKSSKISIEVFTGLLAQTLKETMPGTKIMSQGTVMQNGNSLGFVELRIKDMGNEIYSLIYFSTANSELVMVNFSCPYKMSKTWKKTAKEIMASLKINKPAKN